MVSNLERVAEALFPQNQARTAENVKFFRGESREVTAEQLASQIVAATEQIRSGYATLILDVDAE